MSKPRNKNLIRRFFPLFLMVWAVSLSLDGLLAADCVETSNGGCPCGQGERLDRGPDGCGDGPTNCEEEPCRENCPDSCPKCSCCAGLIAIVMPVFPAAPALMAGYTLFGCKPPAPAGGVYVDVFRPPENPDLSLMLQK